MSEGLFSPEAIAIPGLDPNRLCDAVVLPRTLLHLDLASTSEEAADRRRIETRPDGCAIWYVYFTPDDLAQVGVPEFAMGMVRHEFAAVVAAGLPFPQVVPLDGGGTGFAVSPAGHVVTNYHLVRGDVEARGRTGGVIGSEVLCTTLRARISHRNADGTRAWRDAERVYLVSNPPADRAIAVDDHGRGQLREDTALLRIEPAPSAALPLSARAAQIGDPVWLAGFPLRTARAPEARERRGYRDADGTLRVSAGTVVGVEDDAFVTDADGSMGTSGSPAIDARGEVVGMFSRAVGDGPRNAFEYGQTHRVCVRADQIRDGLGLGELAAGR
ncbi:MAG: serine protease [Myxococcota bacterium]